MHALITCHDSEVHIICQKWKIFLKKIVYYVIMITCTHPSANIDETLILLL